MISFIVIGRNEENNLDRCIASIYGAIHANNLVTYEVIYVDSRSTDRSIFVVKKFREVKIFTLQNYTNAAIGRNVGGMEANGEIFFFIDADMTIKKQFLSQVIKNNELKKYDAISGLVIDVERGIETGTRFKNDTGSFFCPQILDGGTFLITKSAWQKLGGMNTKFKTGEDGDLGLRLASLSLKFHRFPSPIVHHHMVHYHDPDRMWKRIRDKSVFYSRGILYREHLLNRHMYCMLWENDKTLIIFLASMAACLAFPSSALIFISGYFLVIALKCLRGSYRARFFEFFMYFILIDILNFSYFLTFYPKNKPIAYSAESTCHTMLPEKTHLKP